MANLYLHKGTSNGSTSKLVEQSLTHGHIRNAGHSICDDDDSWKPDKLVVTHLHHQQRRGKPPGDLSCQTFISLSASWLVYSHRQQTAADANFKTAAGVPLHGETLKRKMTLMENLSCLLTNRFSSRSLLKKVQQQRWTEEALPDGSWS